jgi:hypothetical protein
MYLNTSICVITSQRTFSTLISQVQHIQFTSSIFDNGRSFSVYTWFFFSWGRLFFTYCVANAAVLRDQETIFKMVHWISHFLSLGGEVELKETAGLDLLRLGKGRYGGVNRGKLYDDCG